MGVIMMPAGAMAIRRRGENLLEDSWQFSSAYWGGAPVTYILGGAQADPFGGLQASVFVSMGAPTSDWAQKGGSGQVYATQDELCLSAYYKPTPLFPTYGSIRIYNATKAVTIQQVYTVFGDLSMGLGANTGDGGGIQDAGGGWFRLWIIADQDGRNWKGDTIHARFELFNNATSAGQAIYIAGAQMNGGAAPQAYVRKP